MFPGSLPIDCLRSRFPAWPAPNQDQGRLSLTIELADPQYDAIEFTLKDEDTNEWYAVAPPNLDCFMVE